MGVMHNNYRGEIILPDGKKVKFTIQGTTKVEVERLLKNANKGAKICFK